VRVRAVLHRDQEPRAAGADGREGIAGTVRPVGF
jgi:hypothetical protein